MIQSDAFEQVEIADQSALWDWLARNHAQPHTIWLVTYKKQVADKYVSRDEVLDALIAYGWIDGICRVVDTDRTMQLIAPRKQQVWAQTYKTRAARLETEGRMADPGRAAITRAKAAGQWDALAHVDALEVPDDLRVALDAAGAGEFFGRAAPSYRRNVLRWIAGARTPPTRAKRIAELVARSARQEKVPQF
jgi:uncharacterized protein YdeI (YjbR/CyaY-like superfamily)